MRTRANHVTAALQRNMELIFRVDTKEEEVLCLGTCSGQEKGLLSGHRSVIRQWNANGQLVLTIKCPPGVGTSDVTSLCLSPIDTNRFFASVDKSVLNYDLRNTSAPLHHFTFNKEEISQISTSRCGRFLAACDESGDIEILDVEEGSVFKSCRRGHGNICSAVIFHPRKNWEVISGGLDCHLVRWDFSRGRPLCKVDAHSFVPPGEKLSGYTINPPMIHCLCPLTREPLFACGLGNGSVAVLNAVGKNQLHVKGMAQLHSSAVGCVDSLAATGISREQHLIVSGGNDGQIIVSDMLQLQQGSVTDSGDLADVALVPVVQHLHRSKINWLTTTKDSCVYVADQTSNIHAYRIM